MSIIAHAILRSEHDSAQSAWKSFAEALTAFVPVEILTLHGVAVQLATTESGEDGSNVFTVTQPDMLLWASIVLAILAVPFYLAIVYRKKRKPEWDNWDLVRMLFPSVAFTVWCMFQSPSAFDSLFAVEQNPTRMMIASIMAATLIAVYALIPEPDSE